MKVLNIGVLAHVDAGKTTLTEHILFKSGIIEEAALSIKVRQKQIHWKLSKDEALQ